MLDKVQRAINIKLFFIRGALQEKRFKTIFSNISNIFFLIFFLLRSFLLRLIPQRTVLYFIRKTISNEQPEIPITSYSFKLINSYSQIVDNYAKLRCLESNRLVFESYSQQLQLRFRNGIEACSLTQGDKIISIFFTSQQPFFIDSINYLFHPEINERCIIDIYTLKEHRNKGLYRLLLSEAICYYKSKGYVSLVMWIMKHNVATRRAQISYGFSNVFLRVCLFTFLGLNKTFIKNLDFQLKEL